MKYEFHVGDYVETKTGTIGYVSKVPEKGCSFWTATKLSDCDIDDNRYTVDAPYRIFSFGHFSRIGQYNFTKKDNGKDEGKIKPLVKSWILEGACSNGEYYFDSREVIKKINELVDAVNRLEEKVNEMAQG